MANPKLSWDEIETKAVAFQRRWKVLLKEEDILKDHGHRSLKKS